MKPSDIQSRIRPFRRRAGGFTLLELLLVMSAIAVLSSMALMVLRSAQEDALASRTRTILQRCQTILQYKLESYETRMMPFRQYEIEPGSNLAQNRHLRSRTLIEWLRGEMPCYYEYLFYYPSRESQVANTTVPVSDPQYWPNGPLPGTPDWVGNYEALMGARVSAGMTANRTLLGVVPPADPLGTPPPLNASTNPALWLHRYNPALSAAENKAQSVAEQQQALIDGAECLYAVLHNTWYDDQRGTHFLNSSEIGDLDNDGYPEVLDAWGEPIHFLLCRNLDVAIDRNKDDVVDGLDRDVNGDGNVDYLDTVLDPRFSMTLDELNLQVFSTRSWEF